MNKYYIILLLLFIAFKLLHAQADTAQLWFLLAPTSTLVHWITASDVIWIAEEGYYYPTFDMIINKSCSGFNFWMICFMMLSYTSLQYIEGNKNRIIAITVILCGSYLFTILSNTSRILLLININSAKPGIHQQYPWLHETIGILVYLSFLIIIYQVWVTKPIVKNWLFKFVSGKAGQKYS